MPSTYLFIIGTLLLSLNFVRVAGLAISDWLYFFSLGFALLETVFMNKKNHYPWIKNQFLWSAFLILFGGTISLSYSTNIKIAISEIIQQIYVITIFISLIWIMVRRGQTKNILMVFIVSGTFAACIAIIDYISGSRIGLYLSQTPNDQFWYRFAGPLGHPNKLGFFLAITSTISFAWLIGSKSKRAISRTRLLWFLLFTIQLFGLYLSGSLTAYIGLSFGIFTIVISRKYITTQILKISFITLFIGYLVVSIGIIFGIFSYSQKQLVGNSLINKAIERVQMSTAPSRLLIFDYAINEIIKHPLFGMGYDQISTSGIEFVSRDLHGTIHNIFLQILYTGGSLSFIGWLIVYILIGWNAIKIIIIKDKKLISPLLIGIAAASLSIIIMDQFQDAIYQREKWLVFGLFISSNWELLRIKRETKMNRIDEPTILQNKHI